MGPASPKTVLKTDVPVAYEVHGAGRPALIFVHGWSCDRSYWREQLEPLSREFQVVAVDLGGHGDSGLGRENWTIASFGADVAAVVEELGLDCVILIGHSMGGDVILEAARRLPARVTGLVWVDAYKRLGTTRTREQVEQELAPFRADFAGTTGAFIRGMFPPDADQSLVAWVTADMSSAPPEVALGALAAAITFDREVPGALEALQLPLVAINPDTPPTDVASLERHGIKVSLMSRVGHFPMLEDPERFNRLLTQVVKEFDAAGGGAPPGA